MQSASIQLDPQTLLPHPRLFANAARFASLRAQRDPVTRQIVTLLRANAEGYLTAAPVVHPKEGSLFAMRDLQGRVITLAMMYKLTDEKRYFERAREDLFRLVALPNWGTGHFLDVGEASLAAGIALDWLYDEFSADERERITCAIVDRALLPSLEVREEPSSWLKGDFNWNQVCHAGLSVGALSIAEREPELARKIVSRAVECIPAAGASYAPDGSYPEGPSYWTYGTTFHVIMVEALRSALGTSCGLEALPGFLPSAEFKLQMVAPSGEAYNYADYHNEHTNEALMLWFARELGRSDLATAELKALAERVAVLTADRPPEQPLNVSRFLGLELLWWNPALPATELRLPLHWTAGGHLPLAVLRSSWNDPRATYLAIKGGTPDGSHAHMDVGSFVLEANGVRWALDLGTENYDRMRAAKIDLWNYKQNSSRWTVFRNGPEGHNLPRFDGACQDVTGKAEIRVLPDDAGVVGNEVELSPLYRDQVKSVRRRVRLGPDRAVSIGDEWQTGERETVYSFQWLTTAKVVPLPSGCLRLEQAGETLELQVESNGEFQVATEDVSQAKAPQDSPNPGLSRIVIRQATAAHGTGRLTVKAIPGGRP